MPWFSEIPPLFVSFFATVLLGFVVGLEVHSYRRANDKDLGFGTTRTMTLLALSGFVLAVLDPTLRLFGTGYAILGILLGLKYWNSLSHDEYSLLPSLIALLVFPIGALALLHNTWLLILYAVVILLVLGEKPGIRHLSDKVRSGEAATLAKFMIMAGLILPMLPDQVIIHGLNITWYQLWLSVVAVSGISYLAYLIQTYALPEGGILLAGLLGGLYSSTAATIVLSRHAQQSSHAAQLPYESAIVLASTMMYLRLLVLITVLGHFSTAQQLAPPFILAVVLALTAAWKLRPHTHPAPPEALNDPNDIKHPLEFSTAAIFAALFVIFAFLTQLVVNHYGSNGLHWLAFMVGFSDIDPFILSLLAGHFNVNDHAVIEAILIATASNNLLKAIYALVITRNTRLLRASLALCAISLASLAYFYII